MFGFVLGLLFFGGFFGGEGGGVELMPEFDSIKSSIIRYIDFKLVTI